MSHWYKSRIEQPVQPGDLIYTNELAGMGEHAHFLMFEVVRVTDKSIMVFPRQRVVVGGHGLGMGIASYIAVTCGARCGARVQRLKLSGATYDHMQEGEVLTEVSVLM